MLSLSYLDEYRVGCNARPDPLGRALTAARRAVEIGPANHLAYEALAAAMYFRSLVPQTEQVVIPGVNHLMQMREPKLVAEAIADFLSRHPIG